MKKKLDNIINESIKNTEKFWAKYPIDYTIEFEKKTPDEEYRKTHIKLFEEIKLYKKITKKKTVSQHSIKKIEDKINKNKKNKIKIMPYVAPEKAIKDHLANQKVERATTPDNENDDVEVEQRIHFKPDTSDEDREKAYVFLEKLKKHDPKRELATLEEWAEQIREGTGVDIEKITEVIKKPIYELEIEQDKIDAVRALVLLFLKDKDRDKATEAMVDEAKRRFRIYTIRSDKTDFEMWVYLDGIYVPNGKTHIQELCRKIMWRAYNKAIVDRVIHKVAADTMIEQQYFFDQEPRYEIAVLNGVLNIKTRELKPFTPEKIYFTKLPVIYDPKKECPNIKQHFLDVLKHKEDIHVLQELIGYCLLKEYKHEKAFLFIGNGRNGKGKTLEILKRLIGTDNISALPLTALQAKDGNFNIADLNKKMVNIAGDIDDKGLKNTAMFKALTGRDTINASRKFLGNISFVNYAKMIFCANHMPRNYDDSEAWWRRWIIVEFPYQFISQKEYDELDGSDDHKNKKLCNPDHVEQIISVNELSGLLNWALDGLDRLESNGEFSTSKNTSEVRQMMIRKSSSFEAFFNDMVEKDYDAEITKRELRDAYEKYCRFFKIRALGDRSVKFFLGEQGVGDHRKVIDGKQILYWEGISLKQIPESNTELYPMYRLILFLPRIENEKSKENKETYTLIHSIQEEYIPNSLVMNEKDLLALFDPSTKKMSFDEIRKQCTPDFADKLHATLSRMVSEGVLFCPTPDVYRLL